ncbi:hypothetical protein JCM8547_009185 [Rhodosporidiobolus lusitaniae]
MPSAVPELPPYQRLQPTKEKLDTVDLHLIDLSKFTKPGGKEALVDDLRRAIEQVGFFLVVGHGIPDEEVRRQLAIARYSFDRPLEEKRQHPVNFSVGDYYGFREPVQVFEGSGIKANTHMINIPKDVPSLADVQLKFDFLKPFQPEIKAFTHKVHSRILDPLLRLFALLLELPEEYLAGPHGWEEPSEDHLRYMLHTPRSAEESARLGNHYSKGHTDFGVLTILFPQIVQALQVQVAEGGYKYVPYVPDAVVVKTAEVLTFISGGYIKSTVHRVVRPPADQANHDRLGLLYFSRPANNFPVKVAPSPLIKRLGLYPNVEDPSPPNGYDWGRARVKHSHDRKVISHEKAREPFKFGSHTVQLDCKSLRLSFSPPHPTFSDTSRTLVESPDIAIEKTAPAIEATA